MGYKRWGERLVLYLNPGEEVGECLLEVGGEEDIRLAEISEPGAASLVKLGMFDTEIKDFTETCYWGTYEITSITGNTTRLDGEPYLHVHMVIGNLDHEEYHRGHMIRAMISAIVEIFVNIVSNQTERKVSEGIDLHLSDL